jgi:hypothetical protein
MLTEMPHRLRITCLTTRTLAATALVLALGPSAMGQAYTLEEPESDQRPRMTTLEVAIAGGVVTSGGAGKTYRHDLGASAAYRFHERRLGGAGRDAAAFRSVRRFSQAAVRTKISDQLTEVSLHPTIRLIAVNGRRQGLLRYALQGLLTREALDLLEMPCDPLAIVPLLPKRQVEVGDEWKPDEWAIQMLTAIEAVEESSLSCVREEVTDGVARVKFTGRMAGVKLGAPSNIQLEGTYEYHLEDQLITNVTLTQTEKVAMGVVNPGIDSTTSVTLNRSLTDSDGGLTEAILESVPLDPPPERLPLVLTAAPWSLRLMHSRGWHVFHASYEEDPKVCILRLLDHGSLICQCNFSPVPDAEPGTHTPLETYEASIRQALGQQFSEFSDRTTVPTEDGRKIFRVTAVGNYQLPDGEATRSVPMSWTYYLVAAPSGRQVSFVFAIEPGLRKRLRDRDLELVQSLRFDERPR